MKATELVSKITNFMYEDKEVFIHIYTRDENNRVIRTEVFPLTAAFSHERGVVKLCLEDKERNIIKGLAE